MRVRIYDCDEAGNETERCGCDLAECFPDLDDEYHSAANELKRAGRVWIGGGAAPLVLLKATEG